jgi:hypothetical protein
MLPVGFKHTILLFELLKILYALDGGDTVIDVIIKIKIELLFIYYYYY